MGGPADGWMMGGAVGTDPATVWAPCSPDRLHDRPRAAARRLTGTPRSVNAQLHRNGGTRCLASGRQAPGAARRDNWAHRRRPMSRSQSR